MLGSGFNPDCPLAPLLLQPHSHARPPYLMPPRACPCPRPLPCTTPSSPLHIVRQIEVLQRALEVRAKELSRKLGGADVTAGLLHSLAGGGW